MRKLIVLMSIVIFFVTFVKGQSTSLYTSTGALKIDPTYKIKTDYLKYITIYENENVFHQIYENIDYPKKCYENRIGGLVIAKISLNRKNLSIVCTIEMARERLLGRAVIDAVYKSSLHLFKATPTDDEVVFYLPFKFEVESAKFNSELKKNELIKIEKAFHEGRMQLL